MTAFRRGMTENINQELDNVKDNNTPIYSFVNLVNVNTDYYWLNNISQYLEIFFSAES